MKKILAMMLTAAMMLSMGTAVLADEVTYTDSAAMENAFTIKKTYKSTDEFVPGETLTFTVTPDAKNPNEKGENPLITVGTANTFTVSPSAATENAIPVSLPSYDEVGVYRYEIKEVEGKTAGVTTYDTNKVIHVIVLVQYNNTTNAIEVGNITNYIEEIGGKKTDTFENEFKTGDFTVAKNVTGNLANKNDDFYVKVTLTTEDEILTDIVVGGTTVTPAEWVDGVYTTTLVISESDDVTTFENIPYDVVVEIEELETITTTVDGEEKTENVMNGYTRDGYTVDGILSKVSEVEFTVEAASKAVVVENSKGTEVDTGISVDSIPYLAMLGVVAIGGTGFMVSKKRRSED